MQSPWHADIPMALIVLLAVVSPIMFLFNLDIVLDERTEGYLVYVVVCIILRVC